MTPIPTLTDHLLCSDVVLIMSENAAPQNQGAGDESSAVIGADGPRRRVKLLTTELAQECATEMFTQLANGPHSTKAELIFAQPTIEEIGILQAAVLVAIGEKGSEKRAHANSLCADGLIDLEQGLGYVLCDRFVGVMPSPIGARGIGKRAADKPAGKKEKERWKEKAKAARQAARKSGADDEAVAAAGQVARAKAEAAFIEMEVAISGLERPSDSPMPPVAAVPEPPPPTPSHECSAACYADMCPHAHAMYDMATSQEASTAIAAAFLVVALSRRGDKHFNKKLELQQVQADVHYRHALRRLQQAYPGEFCGFSQNSARQMVDWALRIEAMGLQVPAARAAAQKLCFDFESAVADRREQLECDSGAVLV